MSRSMLEKFLCATRALICFWGKCIELWVTVNGDEKWIEMRCVCNFVMWSKMMTSGDENWDVIMRWGVGGLWEKKFVNFWDFWWKFKKLLQQLLCAKYYAQIIYLGWNLVGRSRFNVKMTSSIFYWTNNQFYKSISF